MAIRRYNTRVLCGPDKKLAEHVRFTANAYMVNMSYYDESKDRVSMFNQDGTWVVDFCLSKEIQEHVINMCNMRKTMLGRNVFTAHW